MNEPEQTLGPRPEADSVQQTGRLLGDWLRDEAPVHPPPVTMPNARARIALTRRRPAPLIRDWWRWRPGRSNRGFRRMNAVTQLAAVAVLALSGFGLYLVATDPAATEPSAPGAALDPEAVVASVSGLAVGDFTGALESTHTDLGWVYEDMPARATFYADDPRLQGQAEMLFDWIDFEPEMRQGVAVVSVDTVISNDDGAWQGMLKGIRYPDEAFGDQHLAGVLTGSGAYEGLTAYLFLDSDAGSHSFAGVIFPGDMPK